MHLRVQVDKGRVHLLHALLQVFELPADQASSHAKKDATDFRCSSCSAGLQALQWLAAPTAGTQGVGMYGRPAHLTALTCQSSGFVFCCAAPPMCSEFRELSAN